MLYAHHQWGKGSPLEGRVINTNIFLLSYRWTLSCNISIWLITKANVIGLDDDDRGKLKILFFLVISNETHS